VGLVALAMSPAVTAYRRDCSIICWIRSRFERCASRLPWNVSEQVAGHGDVATLYLHSVDHVAPSGNELFALGDLFTSAWRAAGADERGLAAIRRLRAVEDDRARPTLTVFKALLREQYFMLLIDEEATLAAISALLPPDRELRRKGFAALRQVLSARGDITGEAAERFQRIARLFGVELEPTVVAPADAPVQKTRKAS
jgi:hypothetical protein